MNDVTHFHERIEHWMDVLSDLPARVRRKLIPARALKNAEGRGVKLVGRERAKTYAAAAYEAGGVWTIGVNFNAAPAGCQDCGHANWESDAITCGWSIEPRESRVSYAYGCGPSYEKRLEQAVASERTQSHTHPRAYLEYARSKGALGDDGHIDVDLTYRQCSKCDPLEEDDDDD